MSATVIHFQPTPQARKVYAHLTKKKLIPPTAIVKGALDFEQAMAIPDEEERHAALQRYLDTMNAKTWPIEPKSEASLHMPKHVPYKPGQKIILGSDTEGRRVKDWQNPQRNAILLYAEAMGIDEDEARERIQAQYAAGNGHVTYNRREN
jgi:hypothetical protein